MARVLIVSDTHGLIRSELGEALKECDYILHAGDFDDEETWRVLRDAAKLLAVKGNNDIDEWADELPYVCLYEIETVKFLLVHDIDDLPEDLPACDFVIFGHSHKYHSELKDGICYLNPGSCGPRRFRLGLSYVLMDINDGKYTYEKIELRGK